MLLLSWIANIIVIDNASHHLCYIGPERVYIYYLIIMRKPILFWLPVLLSEAYFEMFIAISIALIINDLILLYMNNSSLIHRIKCHIVYYAVCLLNLESHKINTPYGDITVRCRGKNKQHILTYYITHTKLDPEDAAKFVFILDIKNMDWWHEIIYDDIPNGIIFTRDEIVLFAKERRIYTKYIFYESVPIALSFHN